MLELLLTVLLERQALNELGRKVLWEVLSRVMLESGPVEEDLTNGWEKNVLLV